MGESGRAHGTASAEIDGGEGVEPKDEGAGLLLLYDDGLHGDRCTLQRHDGGAAWSSRLLWLLQVLQHHERGVATGVLLTVLKRRR